MDAFSRRLAFYEHSPFRRPAWRWNLARDYARRGLHDRAEFPGWLVETVDFLRAHRLGKRTARIDHLTSCFPDLSKAFDLAREKTPRRWQVEARLLAGQTSEEIAHRCDLPAAVVENFEIVFFNVRDRLEARDWVVCSLIGSPVWQGFGPDDIRRLWRFAGYFWGPVFLDVVIAVTGPKPEVLPEADSHRGADRQRDDPVIPTAVTDAVRSLLRVMGQCGDPLAEVRAGAVFLGQMIQLESLKQAQRSLGSPLENVWAPHWSSLATPAILPAESESAETSTNSDAEFIGTRQAA